MSAADPLPQTAAELAARSMIPYAALTRVAEGAERDALVALVQPWEVSSGDTLRRDLRFADFKAALACVNVVGDLAEEAQHHPDIEFGWGRVRLSLTTHDRGGLTLNDFILAARIESRLSQPAG